MNRLEAIREAFRSHEFPTFTKQGNYSTCDFDEYGALETLKRLGFTVISINCPYCDGTGAFEVESGDEEHGRTINCPICKGTGKVE